MHDVQARNNHNVGRCYIDTSHNSFQGIIWANTDITTWQGNFNAYCSLNSPVEDCGHESLCKGLSIAATGTVFRLLAYSTTNPIPLPPMENCADDVVRRETANNLPTDKTRCNEDISKHKETQVHIKNRVWLGYAYLYTGLISQARSRAQYTMCTTMGVGSSTCHPSLTAIRYRRMTPLRM